MRKEISTEKGAEPKGPYSQAIVTEGPMVYISGQGPVDPETGAFRFGSFREQAELTFRNVGALLEAADTTWAQVVKVGVFLADLGDFAEMNEIYKQFVQPPYPARTTVGAGLPPKMAIEVDCIASIARD